jgi:hypothetical protein
MGRWLNIKKMKYNNKKTIEKIAKYMDGAEINPPKKKPFYNLFKALISDPFFKYVDEHPEFLDTKDIKFRKK